MRAAKRPLGVVHQERDQPDALGSPALRRKVRRIVPPVPASNADPTPPSEDISQHQVVEGLLHVRHTVVVLVDILGQVFVPLVVRRRVVRAGDGISTTAGSTITSSANSAAVLRAASVSLRRVVAGV